MLDTQVLLDSPARHASVIPTPFACRRTDDGDGAAWVRPVGELDIATSPRFERTLIQAQRQADLVVSDLRGVTFADSSAIHVLVNARSRAQREGNRLIILRGPPHVDRIFALTDTVEVVDAG